jgi:hypothetical protein
MAYSHQVGPDIDDNQLMIWEFSFKDPMQQVIGMREATSLDKSYLFLWHLYFPGLRVCMRKLRACVA